VTISNALVLGNGVNVGIGNTAPTAKLHVTAGASQQQRFAVGEPDQRQSGGSEREQVSDR